MFLVPCHACGTSSCSTCVRLCITNFWRYVSLPDKMLRINFLRSVNLLLSGRVVCCVLCVVGAGESFVYIQTTLFRGGIPKHHHTFSLEQVHLIHDVSTVALNVPSR